MVGGDGLTTWYTDVSTQATVGSGTWARSHGGYDLAGSGPDPLGWWLLGTQLDRATVDLARFSWAIGRATDVPVQGDEVFSMVNGELRREVFSEGRDALVYKNGLLELPADVHAGSTWASQGTVVGTADGTPGKSAAYTAQGTASAPAEADLAAAGCLDVSLAESYNGSLLTTTRTWCPGRGMVRFNLDDVAYTTHAPAAFTYPVTGDSFDWSRLAGAASATITLSPRGGSLLTLSFASRPGVLADGTLVVALKNENDVVAINPAATTGNQDRTVWRAHPGGVILTCVTLGQVTVATTSERRVVAYGPTGVALWVASMPDSVNQPAISFAGLIVVGSVDGTVQALDPGTGQVAWRVKMPSELALQPVASGDSMVVIDENGTTAAYGRDGHELWRSAELPAGAYTISGGVVVVNERGAATLRGYDLATGTKLWRYWEPDVVRSLADLSGVALAYTTQGAKAFDPATGTVLWSVSQQPLDLIVVADRVVLATADNLLVFDAAGTETARIPHGLSRLPAATIYLAAGTGSLVATTSTELFHEVLR